MKKYILLLFVATPLVACTSSTEQYYLNHPKFLQEALQACPAKEPKGWTCEKIESMGHRMQELAYQLQNNPQGFGGSILNLQQEIAKQQKALGQEPANTQLAAELEKNLQALQYHLAVVKWLESPRG